MQLYFLFIINLLTLPNGLVKDNLYDKTVSCASTGLISYSRANLAEQGITDKQETINLLKSAFQITTANSEKGWLYHFTSQDGKPMEWSEISSIDTVLFYASFQKAAELLQDEELLNIVGNKIKELKDPQNIEWMMHGEYFRHGYYKDQSLPLWTGYSEGILIYRFFDKEFIPNETRYDLPLFVYYYPLIFYNDEDIEWNLIKAIEWQKHTYNGQWGITACDGPHGYQINSPDVISPLAKLACFKYEKEFTLPVTAYSKDWTSKNYYGIDVGSTYLMLYGK